MWIVCLSLLPHTTLSSFQSYNGIWSLNWWTPNPNPNPYPFHLHFLMTSSYRLYLVFELVDTDLKKFMDSNKAPLHPDLVQSYTCQIFEGKAWMHGWILYTKG